MKAHRHNLVRRDLRKAACRYKVVAVGIDHRNRVISIRVNRPRHHKYQGSCHAEEAVIHSSPRSLRVVLVGRVNPRGTRVLPIDPCDRCRRLADKYGVKIERLVP